jgi:hypothetical protein
MSSENLYVTVRAPLATLPLAKWTVICTYEQFWDSRLSRLASEHVPAPRRSGRSGFSYSVVPPDLS